MRILSLDWDTAYQRDLATELEAAGYSVERLQRAGDALDCYAERPFDLVISETRLPDKSGLQFLRELAAMRGGQAPAVVFLTGVHRPEVRDLCCDAGARRFVQKQVGWPVVMAEIHRVIAELPQESADARVPATPRAAARGLHALTPGSAEPTAATSDTRVFQGKLGPIEILDIIQLLNLGKKTGALVLTGAGVEGRLVFDKGEVVDARSQREVGVRAFASLIALEGGVFRFEAEPAAAERTIHQPTATLLLDVLRIQDESSRARPDGTPVCAADEDVAFDFEACHDDSLLLGAEQEDGGWLAPPPPRAADGVDPGLLRAASLALDAGDGMWPEASAAALWPATGESLSSAAADTTRALGPRSVDVPPAERAPRALPDPSSPSGRPACRRVLLRGRGRVSGVSGRIRRRALLASAAALLIGGYAASTPNLLSSRAEAMEVPDSRGLFLGAAAHQAEIDSLEQVLRGFTVSVRRGELSAAAGAGRIAAVQSEIRRTSADLDEILEGIDVLLAGDTGREGST